MSFSMPWLIFWARRLTWEAAVATFLKWGCNRVHNHTNALIHIMSHIMPNTHRRQRRSDATVELSRVGGVYRASHRRSNGNGTLTKKTTSTATIERRKFSVQKAGRKHLVWWTITLTHLHRQRNSGIWNVSSHFAVSHFAVSHFLGVGLGLGVRVKIRVRLKIRGLELGFRNKVRVKGYGQSQR